MGILDRFRGNKKDQTGDAVQWSKKSLELWQKGSLDLAP